MFPLTIDTELALIVLAAVMVGACFGVLLVGLVNLRKEGRR